MRKFTSPLEGLRVAAPCPADWNKMVGDERVRYCGQCSLHVYNLSGMTKREAEGLVANAEGRLCVRYYMRADGSVLTSNCPVGLRAVRQRVSRVAGAALSAVLGFFAGIGLNFGLSPAPFRHAMGGISAPAGPRYDGPPTLEVPPPDARETTGVIAVDPPPHVLGRLMPKGKEAYDSDVTVVPTGKRPKHSR